MAKTPYDMVDQDFKEEIERKGAAEINATIAELAKRQEDIEKQKADDKDLANLKEQYKEAGAYYRDAKKTLKQKIQFAIEMLEAKGAH